MAESFEKKQQSSKELLNVKGDGSNEAVIESLFNKKEKPKTFKIARSPLFDQLESFLPNLKSANEVLLTKDEKELDDLDIENTDDCDKVIEMNVVLGEVDENKVSILNDDDVSSSSGDDSDNDDSDSGVSGTVNEKTIILPKNSNTSKNLIEPMDSDSDTTTVTSSDSAIR